MFYRFYVTGAPPGSYKFTLRPGTPAGNLRNV